MAEGEAQGELDRILDAPACDLEPQQAGDGSQADDGAAQTPPVRPGTAEQETEQRLDEVQQKFSSSPSRQGLGSSFGDGSAAGSAQQTAPGHRTEEAGSSGSTSHAAEEGELEQQEEEEDFGDAASGVEAGEEPGDDEARTSAAAGGPSQDLKDLQGLVDEIADAEDVGDAAINARWEAAMQPGGALATLAARGGGEQDDSAVVGGGGLLGSLLGGIRSAAAAAGGALGDTLSKHVRVGQRTGESRAAAHARATLPGKQGDKKMNLR